LIRQRIQLALIHLAVAMTLVPINSTLNRVMIKELGISAALVSLLASMPYLFSPVQIMIGSFSDRHPVLGWRRSPYILAGLLLCVLGLVGSPYVAYLYPQSPGLALFLSMLVFGAWGMGFNIASVAYLSLASELSGEKGRSRTVSTMWVVMIIGIIVTAATLSRLLQDFTPQVLERAFLMVAGAALSFGVLGLLRLEPRSAAPQTTDGQTTQRQGWVGLIKGTLANPAARHFFFYLIILLAAILGQDVLLEPFAGEAFGLPVSATTRITSIWGGCVLLALVFAAWMESRLGRKRLAAWSAWIALAGFLVIAASGFLRTTPLFYTGVVVLGIGTGISTNANLALMLDMTTARVGLFIGAWGVADALARFTGNMLSGVVRDVVAGLSQNNITGYGAVFTIQAALLLVSWFMLRRVDVHHFQEENAQMELSERAARLVD